MFVLFLIMAGAIALVVWGIKQGHPFTVAYGVAVIALFVVPFFFDDSDRTGDDDDWGDA
jgi:hypothetical protein